VPLHDSRKAAGAGSAGGLPAGPISENARSSAASAFENVDGEPQRLRNFFFAAELSHVFDR